MGAVVGCSICGGLWGLWWDMGVVLCWAVRDAVGCGGSLCAEQIKRVNGGGSQLVSWRVRVGVFGCLLLPKSSHALPRAMGAALSLEAFTNCVDVALRNVV